MGEIADPTWDEVPQKEIDKELEYWRHSQGASHIWLTPCRYNNSEPTVAGSYRRISPESREYKVSYHWERIQ